MKKFIYLGIRLSKEEQKKIKGGFIMPPGGGSSSCITGMACKVYDSSTTKTYTGNCGMIPLTGGGQDCICLTDLGEYTPKYGVGTSVCWGD